MNNLKKVPAGVWISLVLTGFLAFGYMSGEPKYFWVGLAFLGCFALYQALEIHELRRKYVPDPRANRPRRVETPHSPEEEVDLQINHGHG